MWAGTHFPAVETFLQENDFDILCFQEVAGIGTKHGNVDSKKDYFEELKKILQINHNGELTISQYAQSNPVTGYFGNAIFYKKKFTLQKEHVLTLHKRTTSFPTDAKTFEEVGRDVLHLTLAFENKSLNILTGHLAWATTKEEQPHQIQQNLLLIEYMKKVDKPWILTGDFNIRPDQPSILELEKYGRDLTKEYQVKNTIDPVNHMRWNSMKPGFPIDYIFVSPDVQVDSFQVLENVHMSDHYGLTAILEI